jgi:hypothetical protein
MEMDNTEDNFHIEDGPIPVASSSAPSPPTAIIKSRAPDGENDLSAEEDESHLTSLDNDPTPPAHPSPPPEIIQRRAPDMENDIEMLSAEEDESHLTSLEDDPTLPAHPSPPPEIIHRRASDSVNGVYRLSVDDDDERRSPRALNGVDRLSVDGDDQDQDQVNDAVKSLASTLNAATDMNASQDGVEMPGGSKNFKRPHSRPPLQRKAGRRDQSSNNLVVKPAQSLQNGYKNEVIDLTLEEVSFNSYFWLVF